MHAIKTCSVVLSDFNILITLLLSLAAHIVKVVGGLSISDIFSSFDMILMIHVLSFVLLNKTLNMNEGDRPSQVGSQNIEV